MNYAYASGINNEGDFDQLSLAGVDYGEDYCEDYGITPTNLQGETMYAGNLDQLGMGYHEMGVLPEGLGADFDQMGIVPQGMGGHLNQMGHSQYNQLGHSQYSQLGGLPAGLGGVMDQWNALTPMYKMIAGTAAVIGGIMLTNSLGYTKIKLPLIG